MKEPTDRLLKWRSVVPEQNRFRFYALHVTCDLWGNRLVIRRWGRLYTAGQAQFEWPPDEKGFKNLVEETEKARLAHGYEAAASQGQAG